MANLITYDAYDAALNVLTNATSTVFHLCSSQPATFGNVATYTLGNKTTPTVGSPTSRSPTGRKVIMSAISTGGSVTGTGTAAYWALVDATRLLATGTMTSQAVTSGNTFTTSAFDIVGFPDPS
jgi:hypothetical protein